MMFDSYYHSVVMHLLQPFVIDGRYSTSSTLTYQENRQFAISRVADYITLCF